MTQPYKYYESWTLPSSDKERLRSDIRFMFRKNEDIKKGIVEIPFFMSMNNQNKFINHLFHDSFCFAA